MGRGLHRAPPSDFGELFEQFLAFRDGARIVHFRVAHDALRIEYECRTFVHAALVVKDAVGLAYRAMRPVIRQQRERQSTQLLDPRLETGDGICADLQDLDIQLLEFFVVRTEPGYLILSAAGKGKRQE